jgi:hypothetical protein
MLPHHQIIIKKSSSGYFNSVILARNRQLPDDDRMIETCRSIFKSFNVNNLSVCISWCADQVTRKKYGFCHKCLLTSDPDILLEVQNFKCGFAPKLRVA